MNIVETLIEMAEAQVRNVLLVLHQPLMPTWVIVDQQDEMHFRGTPFGNDREKRLTELMIKAEVRELKAKAYSFITEAWMAIAPPDWNPAAGIPLPEDERPMKRVDRKEIALAFATDGDRCEWRRWIIHRDWNEQIVTLELQQGDCEPKGWMAEMLK